MACVRTNNNYSKYFSLGRGTRQGCPLSPLLFAIAIEPLAIALRASAMAGIKRGELEHKLSLYADDLLLYVSDPCTSIPLVLKLLADFGLISGYKLNLSKSELMPINTAALDYPLGSLPFKSSLQSFKYLGINVTKSFSDLFDLNFVPLVNNLTQDFNRWSLLPLSLIGRVNCIKMNVLPRFLYLFQCIPIFIPKSFFVSLDCSISSFLWNRKTPKIRKSILQRTKQLGGLALPNFQIYYWAANIRSTLYWLNSCKLANPPSWLHIESVSCNKSSSLAALLCLPYTMTPIKYSNNIIVKNSLKIWTQFLRHFGFHNISLLSPIHSNPLFYPSILDSAYASWRDLGLASFGDLYIDGVFASFGQLASQFNVPKSNFFRYLQTRDFVRKKFVNFPNAPPTSDLDTILGIDPCAKGSISKLFNIIVNLQFSSDNLRTTWSQDMGIEITEETWKAVLNRVNSSSICARHRLIQCKVVHRAHWSKSRLARITL